MTTTQLNTVAAAPLWNSKTASQEDVQTLHQTIAKECDANMFKLFLLTCDRFGLDPFQRQIFPVVRNAKKEVDGQWVKVPTLTIQTGIDGFRVIAQRSMEYVGQTPPQWCGEDGKWVDVWLKPVPPSAAKIGVYRRGFVEPIVSVATYKSFVQTDFGGKPQGLWGKMPDVMLAKCCEASALRKAFPNDLSGIYEPAEGASEPIDVTSEGAHPSLRTRTTKTLEVETAPDVSVTDEVVALCNRLRAAFKLAGAPEADAETVCEKWTQDVVNGGKTFEEFQVHVIKAEGKAEKKAAAALAAAIKQEVAVADPVPEPVAISEAEAAENRVRDNWDAINKMLASYCRTKKEIANVKAEMVKAWAPDANTDLANTLAMQETWLNAPIFPFPPKPEVATEEKVQ